MRNPYADRALLLGVSGTDYTAAKDAVVAWLTARPGLEDVDESAARTAHPLLDRQRVWNSIKGDLGLDG